MAGDWHSIEFTREQLLAGELERIRAEFSMFFLLREPSNDMALFTRRTKPGGCEVYFSPACLPYAEFVFERHPAVRARTPSLLGTTLLVGSMAAVGCLLGKPKQVVSYREIIRKQFPASSPFLKSETAAPSFE